MYGDSYLPVNFSDIQAKYDASNKLALMTILKNNDQWDQSNVIFSGRKIIEYNKYKKLPEMSYIDYGLGIINANAFENFSHNASFDLATLYNHFSLNGQLADYEVGTRFYEIGSHSGIIETESYLLGNNIK